MNKIVQLIVLCCLTFTNLFSQQNKTAGNYTYSTECLGIELDGTQTLKSWGNGKNRIDAVEQAKKNAIYDVLFKGIIEGKNTCNTKPIMLEVNAMTKYETYFNTFFTDGGEYLKYISLDDEKLNHKLNREKKGARHSVTYSVIVRVNISALKKKLMDDGILK
jgi:hypothetical protein